MLEWHELVLMDDRAQFEGADHVKIRDRFRQWAKAELERNLEEQQPPGRVRGEIAKALNHWKDLWANFGPRYNIFGIVNRICVEST